MTPIGSIIGDFITVRDLLLISYRNIHWKQDNTKDCTDSYPLTYFRIRAFSANNSSGIPDFRDRIDNFKYFFRFKK